MQLIQTFASIYNHDNYAVEFEKMTVTLLCCRSEAIHSPPQLLNK